MTLCVAAECKPHKKRFLSAVVFATDFKVEGDVASAEIGHKVAVTGREEHPILLAGTLTRALTLAKQISGLHDSLIPVDPKEERIAPDWDSILPVAVKNLKWSLADELVGSRFGFTYDFLLKNGKASLPEDTYRETLSDIARLDLDCWLLVIGFAHSDASIYRINSSGVIETCDNFAAIGSGYYIAESCLFQREQNKSGDLGTTIYNVYEAMKLGSTAPGVGRKFEIAVAEWEYWNELPTNAGNVKISHLEPKYYEYLEKQFRRYGPRPLGKVEARPRWIKEPQQTLVLTPKGMHDPKQKKLMERAKRQKAKQAEKLKQQSASEKLEQAQ